jgi:hypothetical protein
MIFCFFNLYFTVRKKESNRNPPHLAGAEVRFEVGGHDGEHGSSPADGLVRLFEVQGAGGAVEQTLGLRFHVHRLQRARGRVKLQEPAEVL